MIEKHNLEINLQTSAVGIYDVFKFSNARRTALFITISNFQCKENSYENRKEKRLTKYRNYLELSIHIV